MASATHSGAVTIYAAGDLQEQGLLCNRSPYAGALTCVSMMQALYRHLGTADEALLSTAFSWMRKAADDKQDGVFLIFSNCWLALLWVELSFKS